MFRGRAGRGGGEQAVLVPIRPAGPHARSFSGFRAQGVMLMARGIEVQLK